MDNNGGEQKKYRERIGIVILGKQTSSTKVYEYE